ncbi:MAG TPA: glutamate--tRNA ligase family protein, partial [Candidatus Woesebacteria bacterium]|nr:glutamate--tRNA ligase family protein [Candidatus Woesebacteria bacterium]
MVRTRFAPSPTGEIHLGALRTLLYNYALAKHYQGRFILRIEDTDRKRYVEGAEKRIIEDIKAYGLSWDEGPFYQSQRAAIYQQYA